MDVLARAELLLQANNYGGPGDWLDEANSHDAQFGDGATASTFPLFLPHTGRQYVDFPGVTDNWIVDTTPPASADIDVEDVATMAVWYYQPAGAFTFDVAFSTRAAASDGAGLRVAGVSANTPGMFLDGALASVSADSTTGAMSAGAWHHISIIIDHRTGTQLAEIFVDGVSGGTTDISAIGDMAADRLAIGAQSNVSGIMIGRLQSVEFYKTLATAGQIATASAGGVGTLLPLSSPVSVVDFSDTAMLSEPFATFTDPQGNAYTVNRSATGRKLTVVDRPMFLLGTDDYFEIADDDQLDFTGLEDFTLMVAGRHYDVSPAADSVLVFKKDDLTTSAGYGLYLEAADATAKVLIGDGVLDDEDATPNLTAGQAFIVAGVRDTITDDIEAFTDGTGSGSPVTDSTTATLANAFPLRIGATSNAAASFLDGEIHAVALWREALSDADVATATDELNGIFAVARRIIRSPRYGITRMASR